jgi:hypothetical protein
MIYEFIGLTNFEELVKIFIGYKITLFGAQSSVIFMGILLIIVGFKIYDHNSSFPYVGT